MGEDEILIGEQPRRSLAAPLIFFIVVAFQFVSIYLHQLKKKGSKSAAEIQLRAEIKQLLKDASALSQPSTFAQAAKLRRLAAAKEKELANYKEAHDKEMKLSSDSYPKILFISKVSVHSSILFRSLFVFFSEITYKLTWCTGCYVLCAHLLVLEGSCC
ncbi:hypothetical protein NC653_013499 [Populus alba x Populus x berolinensis]|uniref:Uncharacterized protein n=1 Tax=Populus alba x Populus x berolinensis TaxID=444605 RepID=A0AAD6QUH6_9ROSI|nr:hypothetical protein NC653_013499 [Populus alba x Populus x berolinensis]